MPVELTDNIAPSGDSGGTPATFSTHLDTYGNGGYRSVADQSERLGNSGVLTELRRKLGMAVYQQDTNKLYILTNNPATPTTTVSDWTEFTGGSSLAIEDEGTQLTAAAAKINFTGAGVTATAVGDDVTVDIPGGGGSQDLQSVMDNGSVGSVTTNIDMITVDPAVTSGRFCRIRTFLSGTTTRTLIASQGLVGDSASEVVLNARDASSVGFKQSRIELKGLTGDIDVSASNNTTLSTDTLDVEVVSSVSSGSPEVGDVLMINQLINSTYGRLKYKPGVQIKRISVNSVQLQNLFTTPINLISGIGGRYIMILESYVALQSPTVGYNAGVRLEIQNTTYGIPVLQSNEFLQSTQGGTRVFYPMDPSTIGPNDRPVSSSSGWELACTADLGTSGTGTLDMFISYIVIP